MWRPRCNSSLIVRIKTIFPQVIEQIGGDEMPKRLLLRRSAESRDCMQWDFRVVVRWLKYKLGARRVIVVACVSPRGDVVACRSREPRRTCTREVRPGVLVLAEFHGSLSGK